MQQLFTRIVLRTLTVVALLSAAVAARAQDAIPEVEYPPLPISGTTDDVGDPAKPDRPDRPSKPVTKPEVPRASEVGALLQQLVQQQRQQRHDLVDRTRDALAAIRTLPKEERDRARAEALSKADAEREALFAAQREARQALQTRLEEIRAERSGLEPLIDAAKERGVETSRERRGEGRR